jgi:hypothetical protein
MCLCWTKQINLTLLSAIYGKQPDWMAIRQTANPDY